MNSDFNQWLASHLPFPGLLGWSARSRDHTCASHCYVNWLAASQLDQAFARLSDTANLLGGAQDGNARLSWTFEHLRIHLAFRSDGASLALFVQNRADNPSLAAEAVLEQFARLELA